MYTAERVAQHTLMDIFAPFLLSHMTTLNLISFHKQLIVDTVQIVFLIFASRVSFCTKFLSILSLFAVEIIIWKSIDGAQKNKSSFIISKRKFSLWGINRWEYEVMNLLLSAERYIWVRSSNHWVNSSNQSSTAYRHGWLGQIPPANNS